MICPDAQVLRLRFARPQCRFSSVQTNIKNSIDHSPIGEVPLHYHRDNEPERPFQFIRRAGQRTDQNNVIAQLDRVIARCFEITGPVDGAYIQMDDRDRTEIVTICTSAVERIVGMSSTYGQQLARICQPKTESYEQVPICMGVVKALRDDIADGCLERFRELAHADIFDDLLSIAEHLLESGYKDAAAVVGGGALESHLRQLCLKYGVSPEVPSGTKAIPKKADTMNADLAKSRLYTVTNQKHVVAWLDIRNKAAHAEYGKYTSNDVELMLQGVSQFITAHRPKWERHD